MNHPSHSAAATQRSPRVAAMLELGCGLCLQTFGLGHLYLGNHALGWSFMIGYWCVQILNLAAVFVGIGLITFPLTLLAALMISPTIAANTTPRV